MIELKLVIALMDNLYTSNLGLIKLTPIPIKEVKQIVKIEPISPKLNQILWDGWNKT